jgi:hypothetical protein
MILKTPKKNQEKEYTDSGRKGIVRDDVLHALESFDKGNKENGVKGS